MECNEDIAKVRDFLYDGICFRDGYEVFPNKDTIFVKDVAKGKSFTVKITETVDNGN